MATILMKNGEVVEVPDEEMLSFLQQNRDSIQNRQSLRKRPVKRDESSEAQITSTKQHQF
jgi:hypothetical protein